MLVPWRRFSLETPLRADALASSLASLRDDGPMATGWRLARTRRGLRLVRHAVRRGRLRVIAVASLRVSPGPRGSIVAVTIRSPVSAIAFFSYFAASALVGGVALCASAIARGGDAVSLLVCLLSACCMPVAAWSIVALQLVPEVRAAEHAVRAAIPTPPPAGGPFR
ncbi:MAG TPA: hypothetical protein VE987_18215 [Polyangiaceae bacterium]|nr:hypothetical protein [Polyangiaceae bacterium]